MKINKQKLHPLMIYFIIMIVLMILLAVLLTAVNAVSGRYIKNKLSFDRVSRQNDYISETAEKIKLLNPDSDKFSGFLPDETGILNFVSAVEATADQNSIKIKSFKFTRNEPARDPGEKYFSVPFTVEFTAEYSAAVKYFDDLYFLPYVVRINRLNSFVGHDFYGSQNYLLNGRIYVEENFRRY